MSKPSLFLVLRDQRGTRVHMNIAHGTEIVEPVIPPAEDSASVVEPPPVDPVPEPVIEDSRRLVPYGSIAPFPRREHPNALILPDASGKPVLLITVQEPPAGGTATLVLHVLDGSRVQVISPSPSPSLSLSLSHSLSHSHSQSATPAEGGS